MWFWCQSYNVRKYSVHRLPACRCPRPYGGTVIVADRLQVRAGRYPSMSDPIVVPADSRRRRADVPGRRTPRVWGSICPPWGFGIPIATSDGRVSPRVPPSSGIRDQRVPVGVTPDRRGYGLQPRTTRFHLRAALFAPFCSLLVARRDSVVTKDRICARIWPCSHRRQLQIR